MKLFNISQEGLNLYNATKELVKNHSKEDFDLSDFINQRQPAKVENDIGFVHIYGTLLRDASPIEKLMGNTDYDDFQNDLAEVVNLGAKAVILITDSGGGHTMGSIEAAEAVSSLSVPVVAYVKGNACSAAYKIISGATYIVATKSAQSGNIGTIMAYVDYTKAHEMMGVELKAITNESGVLKSTGHLDGFTEEQLAFLQESINEAGLSFQTHVFNSRPGLSEEVLKAGWYSSAKAIELGLIDEIGNLDLAILRANQLVEALS